MLFIYSNVDGANPYHTLYYYYTFTRIREFHYIYKTKKRYQPTLPQVELPHVYAMYMFLQPFHEANLCIFANLLDSVRMFIFFIFLGTTFRPVKLVQFFVIYIFFIYIYTFYGQGIFKFKPVIF